MSKHDDAEKWYTSEEPFSWVESTKREHIDFLLEQSRKLEEMRDRVDEWERARPKGACTMDFNGSYLLEIQDILSPPTDERRTGATERCTCQQYAWAGTSEHAEMHFVRDPSCPIHGKVECKCPQAHP